MSELSTALSALRANQTALYIVGNNIANANDPTYHRQDVQFVERPPMDFNGIQIGQGVEVAGVRRIYDSVTETALTRNISEKSGAEAQLRIARQLEAMFTPGQGTVLDRLENLFNELERLTANPDDAASRSIVIRTADALATEINGLARQMDEIVETLRNEVVANVEFINQAANEIAELNIQIRNAVVKGQDPNDLLDSRDRLVNELAEVIDVEIVTQDSSGAPQYVLVMAGGQLQVTQPGLELVTGIGPDGSIVVCRRGGRPIDLSTGTIGALTDAEQQIIGPYRERLQTLLTGIIRGFDRVHATGIGTYGKFDQLVSHRFVKETDVPLDFAATVIPVEAGELLIGVTDADGNRVMEAVQIDPAIDSFADVVAKLDAVDRLNATLLDPPGQVALTSEPGYLFDFMMARPASVNTNLLTGSTQPTIAGMYEGDRDTQLTFDFSGSGEIGVTPDLMMNVRDQSGALLGTYAVGQGYEPDSDIHLGDGVKLSLSTGDVQAGDEFSIKLVQEPDATNFLAAAGLNTLFTGTSAHDFAVSHDIATNHARLATTRSGLPLDSRNAEAMVALRHQQVLDGGQQTIESYLRQTISLIGGDVQDMTARQETLEAVSQSLLADRASVSGVDPNEEAVKMLQFQRAFQAIAQYITTIDEMYDVLTNMLN